MNASDVLKYGQQWLMKIVDGFPEKEWRTSGVCGVWSAQDVMAHLASYEVMLVEILANLVSSGPTPTLDNYLNTYTTFNDDQVALRKDRTIGEVMAEYQACYDTTQTYITRIPIETQRQAGTLAWYGAEYDLEDLIVYSYYGHKREHGAQIAAFCDRLSRH